MKNCPNCNAQLADDAVFCTNCGNTVAAQTQQNPNSNPNNYAQQTYQQPQYAPVVNVYDHTADFAPEDVHKNKLFALLCYIMGVVGVVIALLARSGENSEYLSFHIRNALKIAILQMLVAVITVLLAWTCIVPFAGGVCLAILTVVNIISFFQTCGNKSVETPIVRNFTFLN